MSNEVLSDDLQLGTKTSLLSVYMSGSVVSCCCVCQ